MQNNEANDEKYFVDERAKQASLIKRPARADRESRIDRGASNEFADDRQELEENEDTGKQSSLTGDNKQKTLNGDRTGREWF